MCALGNIVLKQTASNMVTTKRRHFSGEKWKTKSDRRRNFANFSDFARKSTKYARLEKRSRQPNRYLLACSSLVSRRRDQTTRHCFANRLVPAVL